MTIRPATAYITTPIYYVNDKPHIGHAYTTTIADVWARFMRFRGRDVFFLTGTDEHALKVVEAAAQRGLTPLAWADQNAEAFQAAFRLLGVSNDDFIRTTEPRHKERVQRYVAELLQSGDVYLGEYVGWYDAGQEEYIPESKAKEYDYKSPFNGKPLVRKTEHNYFFRLSAYRAALLELLEGADDGFTVLPEVRKNEIIARIREMEDVPISRLAAEGGGDWGIRIPGDEGHTIYVWIDALFNYLSTVDTDERRQYWSGGAVHVIAKDILWFHAAIWPAMLLALRQRPGYEWVRLPRFVYSHSFWISEGQKMSKTLGNFIDLPTIERYKATYSLDAWRYYMATRGPLGTTDADFAAAHFHEIYHAELVNTVGNCASRVTAMIGKYFEGLMPGERDDQGERIVFEGFDWPTLTDTAITRAGEAMERLDIDAAIGEAIGLIRKVDGFIHGTEPFKRIKDESKRAEVGAILYQSLEVVRIASLLLAPVCIEGMPRLWRAIGYTVDPERDELAIHARWGALNVGAPVEKVALYPRVELETARQE